MSIGNINSISSVSNDKKSKCIIFFSAAWHKDCAEDGILDTVFASLAQLESEGENTVQYYKVEAEEAIDLSSHCGVTVVPTFVSLVGHKVIERIEGEDAHAARVSQAVRYLKEFDGSMYSTSTAVETVSANNSDVHTTTKSKTELLDDRMDSLVNASDVMLFMKGTPLAPRCGFSRQVVELLQEAGIEFGSFDILGSNDQDVREGLKKKSDWPTYPQIYVKGELIGGLDILKEMTEVGDLAEQIGVQKKESLNDRLKRIVHRSNIMLFMKGLPSAPKCGFSRQIVEILEEQGVEFDAFDILSDEG